MLVGSPCPPTASIAAGDTQQFTATGVYSDGSTNLTERHLVLHSTSVATSRAPGLATGVGTGATTITAPSLGSLSGTAALTVAPAVLVAITVSPPPPLAAGDTQQFTATGVYSDGSTQT